MSDALNGSLFNEGLLTANDADHEQTPTSGFVTSPDFRSRNFGKRSVVKKTKENVFQSIETLESISFPRCVIIVSGFIH
jgi:hypothetical protein